MTVNVNNLFWKVYNSKYKINLINLLKKFRLNIKIILQKINNNEKDENIYNYIIKNNNFNKAYGSISTNRGYKRAKDIVNILQSIDKNKKIDKLLDIGCNIGEITLEIKKLLNLNTDNAICIDVESFAGKKIVPLKGIKYYTYDGVNIPFKDNFFNLSTILQVLHHVEQLDLFLNNFSKVMKLNSIVILREHDCLNDEFSNLIDIEHMIWAAIENTSYNIFVKNSYSNYFSKDRLIKIMENIGFENCKIDNYYSKNSGPTNYYYCAFKKIK